MTQYSPNPFYFELGVVFRVVPKFGWLRNNPSNTSHHFLGVPHQRAISLYILYMYVHYRSKADKEYFELSLCHEIGLKSSLEVLHVHRRIFSESNPSCYNLL